MNVEIKQRLIKYLYPTTDLMSFMCNDLHQELLEVIPRNICISCKNISSKIRKGNSQLVRKTIYNFIDNNMNYKALILDYYKKIILTLL